MKWVYGAKAHQGVYHEAEGIPCQDYAKCLTLPNPEIIIAVVADGAGTSAHAGVGAAFFGDRLHEIVSERLAQTQGNLTALETTLLSLIEDLQSAGQAFADRHGWQLDDLATTLLALVATPKGYCAFQVGDGFIVGEETFNQLTMITQGPTTEYVNETSFVTDRGVKPNVQVRETPLKFFALSSDGLAPVAIDAKSQRPHQGFFAPFQEYLMASPRPEGIDQELHSFMRSHPLRTRVKDDTSLIIGAWV